MWPLATRSAPSTTWPCSRSRASCSGSEGRSAIDYTRPRSMPSDHSTPQPAWYLDELAHAGPEHLDAAYVAGYDRKARVDPTTELAHLQALGLGQASTLVDLGAGTGTMSLAAAPLCRRVLAVDVSPVMLAVLRREAEQRGLANIE